jgi:hypothetical protein
MARKEGLEIKIIFWTDCVLCEVSNGAEGRFRNKNNILDRWCSL